jgi:hypothetical protein
MGIMFPLLCLPSWQVATHASSLSAVKSKNASCYRGNYDKTNGQPLLYFASVISRDTEELPFLYSSLAADIGDYLDGAGLQLTHGLAIAASAAGKQHLEYNGFRSLSARYLDRYEFMTITAKDARTSFWRHLLTATQNSLPPFAHECVHLETS